jgi:hypothetical protein
MASTGSRANVAMSGQAKRPASRRVQDPRTTGTSARIPERTRASCRYPQRAVVRWVARKVRAVGWPSTASRGLPGDLHRRMLSQRLALPRSARRPFPAPRSVSCERLGASLDARLGNYMRVTVGGGSSPRAAPSFRWWRCPAVTPLPALHRVAAAAVPGRGGYGVTDTWLHQEIPDADSCRPVAASAAAMADSLAWRQLAVHAGGLLRETRSGPRSCQGLERHFCRTAATAGLGPMVTGNGA